MIDEDYQQSNQQSAGAQDKLRIKLIDHHNNEIQQLSPAGSSSAHIMKEDYESTCTNEIGRDASQYKTSSKKKGKSDVFTQGGQDQHDSKLPIKQVDLNELSNSQIQEVYVVFKRRWLILTLFSLCAFVNQMCWISMQPIADRLSKVYKQPATVINTISLAYQGIYIIVNFPSNYALDVYGCRKGVLTGILLTTLGMIIKIFINQGGFIIVIVGQCFAAVGQPFILNASAKVASVWFGLDQRVVALSIAIGAQAIGVCFGFIIPMIFVQTDEKLSTDDQFKQQVMVSLIVQAVMGVILSIACILLFQEKPPKPPSATANALIQEKGQFMKQIYAMFKNPDFMILTLLFGQMLGANNTIGTVIGEIAPALGYDDIYSSVFGACFIVGGCIGCGVFGAIVEKHQCYKKAVITSCFFATLFMFILYTLLSEKIGLLMSGLCFILGGFMFPIMVTAFDFGVELTYPVGESMSVGVLMSAGQIFGIVYTVICSILMTNDKVQGSYTSILILVGACGFATILSPFVRQKLRRQELEKVRMELKEQQERIQESNVMPSNYQ